MKTFYLLKLQYNANTVLAEYKAMTIEQAIRRFNETVTLSAGPNKPNVPLGLDERGYRKGDPQVGESITYTVAQRHEHCSSNL